MTTKTYELIKKGKKSCYSFELILQIYVFCIKLNLQIHMTHHIIFYAYTKDSLTDKSKLRHVFYELQILGNSPLLSTIH